MAKVSFSKPGTESLAPAIDVAATVTPDVTSSQPSTAPVVPTQPTQAPSTAPVVPTQPTQTATTGEAPAATTVAAPASPTPTAIITVTPSPGVPAVIAPSGVPATHTANNPGFYDDQNISASDLKLPRFNIVQKVGELSNIHTPGAIVLDGSLTLADAPKQNAESSPVRFLVVGLQPKKLVEKVEGGLRGNVFDTDQQVVAAGGTLDYNEAKATQKPLYQTLITGLILIEKPANLDPNSFPLDLDGKQYCLALYSMKGTSYTNAAKHILTARKMGACKEGFRFGWWTMTSKLKAYGQNFSYIPVVRPQEKSTPELRAYLTELLGF